MPLLLLTAHQFRERYGIHRNTPRAWERRGLGPHPGGGPKALMGALVD
ncbi:hypothetical protein [Meiothermus luteus]|nr:hypothetical protein [Meiothermus luteus]